MGPTASPRYQLGRRGVRGELLLCFHLLSFRQAPRASLLCPLPPTPATSSPCTDLLLPPLLGSGVLELVAALGEFLLAAQALGGVAGLLVESHLVGARLRLELEVAQRLLLRAAPGGRGRKGVVRG